MREIIILGANGFVGSTLAAAALSRDDLRLVLGSRKPFDIGTIAPGPSARARVETLAYGRLEDADIERLARADAIVDLVSPGRTRFGSAFDLAPRIAGHVRLADGLATRGWEGHLVFISSGGTIYGGGSPEPIAESALRRPLGEYALEKAVVELHLQTLAERDALASATLRVANVYGPTQPARAGFGIVPAIAQALRDGTPFTRYGTGEAVRDYVFVDDVVEAVLRALDMRATGKFNIGSGRGTSVNELIGTARELSSRPLLVSAVESPAGEPEAVVLDCALAERTMGWKARVDVREGLRRTLAHHGLIA